MAILFAALLAGVLAPPPPIDNEYFRASRNAAPCAVASPSACGERVLVALGPIDFQQYGLRRHLERGEIAMFLWNESYTPPLVGEFVEVSIKPDHPKVTPPRVALPPEKNSLLFDGEMFFVFEEKLEPGDTRPRHSHAERIVIVLNSTELDQWPDGQPELFRIETPDEVRFNKPVTHVVKNVGDKPLRNIVIELKP